MGKIRDPLNGKEYVLPETKLMGKIIVWLFIGIFGLWLFFGVWTGVPAGAVGIQDSYGAVSPQTLEQGFHLKAPWVSIIPMSFQTQKYPATATAASSDLQDVKTEVTVNYHINKNRAVEIYNNYSVSYADRIISPTVQETVKAITARFTAAGLITERPSVKQEIETQLSQKLEPYGVIVEAVSLTDFQFSPSFTQAIEAKVTAEQRALEAKNKLEQIKIEKEQTITLAEASAESTRLKADAEAYSLQVIREQLLKSNSLISYKSIEKWNGQLPYVSGGSGFLPLINLPFSDNTVVSDFNGG